MVDQSKQIDLAKNQLVVEALTIGATVPGNIATSISAGAVSASTLSLSSTATIAGNTVIQGTLTTTGAQTFTGTATFSGAVQGSGSILSTSPTGGVGYLTGAGGSISQGTSGSTGVTQNTACGAVTLFAQSLATVTGYSFVLTNSAVSAADLLVLQPSTTALAALGMTYAAVPASGSATIVLRNTTAASVQSTGTLQYAVVKAVQA